MARTNNRLIEGLLLAVIVGSFYIVIQPMNEASALQLVSVSTGNQSATLNVPIVYNNWNAHVVIAGKFLLVVNSKSPELNSNDDLANSVNNFLRSQ